MERRPRRDQPQRVDRVRDVDEIAHLRAVPLDDNLARVVANLDHQVVDDVGAQAGAEVGKEARRRRVQAVDARIQIDVAFGGELRHGVGRHRRRRVVLAHRHAAALAVDRGARRKYQACLRARLPDGFEQVERRARVAIVIAQRLADRRGHAGEAGEVKNRRRPVRLEMAGDVAAGELDLDRLEAAGLRREMTRGGPGARRVDCDRPFAIGDEGVDEMRSDEPGGARDQRRAAGRAHGRSSWPVNPRLFSLGAISS